MSRTLRSATLLLALVAVVRPSPYAQSLLDVRLFGRPDFATGAIGITILFFANFGFFFIEMQYLQLVLGYSPLQTAFALAPLAEGGMPAYSPRVARMSSPSIAMPLPSRRWHTCRASPSASAIRLHVSLPAHTHCSSDCQRSLATAFASSTRRASDAARRRRSPWWARIRCRTRLPRTFCRS